MGRFLAIYEDGKPGHEWMTDAAQAMIVAALAHQAEALDRQARSRALGGGVHQAERARLRELARCLR